jgi:hypothetical protein
VFKVKGKASKYVSVNDVVVITAVHIAAACCRPERHKVKKKLEKKIK